MKLLRLKIENLKKVKDVELVPTDNLIIVGGKNGQGKTSVFDAYQYLVEGKGVQCKTPVHEGEKRARITGEFQAEPGEDMKDIVVSRTISETGNSVLTITTDDGLKFTKPQIILDKIHNRMRDPLAYIRMDRKEQLRLTQELVGLDFNELDQEYKALYDRRTDVNREARRLKDKLETMPHHDSELQEVSLSDLKGELKIKESQSHLYKDKKDALERIENGIRNTLEEIDRLKLEVKNLQETKTDLEEDLSRMEEPDVQEVWNKLESAEETNRKVRENREYADVQSRLKEQEEKASDINQDLDKIELGKSDQLAKADFPVEGMGFDADGVTYNSLPFTEDQMATSLMLKVATAMSLALRPAEGSTKLNQIFIYRGSELDKESQEMVDQLANEHNAQIFLERVIRNEDDESECQVIIEDGMVRGIETEIIDEFGDI